MTSEYVKARPTYATEPVWQGDIKFIPRYSISREDGFTSHTVALLASAQDAVTMGAALATALRVPFRPMPTLELALAAEQIQEIQDLLKPIGD